MIQENLPSPNEVCSSGKFLGYVMPGYYECYLYQRVAYAIIDGVSSGKYWARTERYKDRKTKLPKGFDLNNGEPIYKFIPRHKLEEMRKNAAGQS